MTTDTKASQMSPAKPSPEQADSLSCPEDHQGVRNSCFTKVWACVLLPHVLTAKSPKVEKIILDYLHKP